MRRILKAVTSMSLAAALALGLVAVGGVGKTSTKAAAPTYLGEVIASKGVKDPNYTPTQIRNGNFDVHPGMYAPKNSSDPSGDAYTMQELFDMLVADGLWTTNQKNAWIEKLGTPNSPSDNPNRRMIKIIT